jgi:hypothetical protein
MNAPDNASVLPPLRNSFAPPAARSESPGRQRWHLDVSGKTNEKSRFRTQ